MLRYNDLCIDIYLCEIDSFVTKVSILSSVNELNYSKSMKIYNKIL